MRMRLLLVLVLCASLPPVASAQSSCATLTHERVAFGSTGVVPLHAPVPGWVVGTLRLRTRCAVRGLRLQRVTLLNAAGAVVADASLELELRVAAPRRSAGDYSRYDTVPVPDVMADGDERVLWIRARIVGDFGQALRRAPVRYRATLHTADGTLLRVEGPLGSPWPTAGPSPVPAPGTPGGTSSS